MAKQVFAVTGMHCSACVMRLEGLEDELPGVRSIRVSLHKQRAEIEYDERRIGFEALRQAFEGEGYGLRPA